jgi:hypothetical protein
MREVPMRDERLTNSAMTRFIVQPLKSDYGVLHGFGLGSFNAILPALSRGKRLQVSISGKPERFVDLAGIAQESRF